MLNNVEKGNNNDSKKIFTIVVLIMTLMVCTTGATYAYFAITATNSVMTGTAATADLSLTVTPADLKAENTEVMVPQLESALDSAMNSTNMCVDDNNNIICKVYTITVTNESTAGVKVYGTVQFSLVDPEPTDQITSYEMENLKWKRATGTTSLGTTTGGSYNGVAVGTINLSSLSPVFDLTSGGICDREGAILTGCTSVSLAAETGSAVYHIVVWINETNNEQSDSGKWVATVNFESDDGKGITSTIIS